MIPYTICCDSDDREDNRFCFSYQLKLIQNKLDTKSDKSNKFLLTHISNVLWYGIQSVCHIVFFSLCSTYGCGRAIASLNRYLDRQTNGVLIVIGRMSCVLVTGMLMRAISFWYRKL